MGNLKGTGKVKNPMTTDEYFGNTDNKRFYDTMTFGQVALPEAVQWETGKEYDLKVRVKLKGKRIEDGNEENVFEILGVASMSDQIKLTPEQEKIKNILG